jgi:hypothetical protein
MRHPAIAKLERRAPQSTGNRVCLARTDSFRGGGGGGGGHTGRHVPRTPVRGTRGTRHGENGGLAICGCAPPGAWSGRGHTQHPDPGGDFLSSQRKLRLKDRRECKEPCATAATPYRAGRRVRGPPEKGSCARGELSQWITRLINTQGAH